MNTNDIAPLPHGEGAAPVQARRRGRKSRRAVIIEQAAQSFYELGFDRTTVRDIAAAAGMTSGSIFYHFPTKEDLLAWVIREGLTLGHETAERALSGATTPVQRYHALFVGHLKALHDDRHIHKVSVQEWSRLGDEARVHLKQMNDRYRERWLNVLTDLSLQGVLKAEPEMVRRTLIASLNWTLHYKIEDLVDLPRLAIRMAAAGLNLSLSEFEICLQEEQASP
ncbi:MAG: hypothetical protein A2792_13530 [Sphingomonadales bacterium RIFCSPHIGHO2_01_FULL_65_20]|nr:MAG: hypothetical protein A2792_13530 [Sphingomonadales bacterium RIFCSPHIGHO2_01_FULL_65_20]